ncbi:HNH endonuclease signature motif containing protein [Streptomyces sp. NPDC051976]|uniref:HNH endonuclease n=1 Tax=Streptomyces sp. NPDC051976 TaxID=3154947 RepID=UPI0034315612
MADKVEQAGLRFRTAAETRTLHELDPGAFRTPGIAPGDFVKWAYKNGMCSAGGRDIYDQIMDAPEDERCPMCGHGEVAQLDHVMPKIKFPALCVDPLNLVPICERCNYAKGQVSPSSAETTPLHPYLDQIDTEGWLDAEIVPNHQGQLTYFVAAPPDWDETLTSRVHHHFALFELAKRYSVQANRTLKSIKQSLQDQLERAGEDAVRAYLLDAAASRLKHDPNSWDGVAHRAWAADDGFCRGAFSTDVLSAPPKRTTPVAITMKNFGLTWTAPDGVHRSSTVSYDKPSAVGRQKELEDAGCTEVEISEINPGQLPEPRP